MLLNGGPMFKINPLISFFIFLKDADAVNTHWDKLSDGGKIMMKLDTYAVAKDMAGALTNLVSTGRLW